MAETGMITRTFPVPSRGGTVPEILDPTGPDTPTARLAPPGMPVTPPEAKPTTIPPTTASSIDPTTRGGEKLVPDKVSTDSAQLQDEAPDRTAAKPAAVTLTISEAARACAVNRRTIRHHRQAGDFPGAFKDQDGMWRIPMEDLEWVGLHPDLGRVAEEPVAASKIDLLRTEVAVLRERLRAAELISMEREKRIDDLRLILRLLPSPSLSGARPGMPGTPRLTASREAGPAGLAAGEASTEPIPARADIAGSDPVIWLPEASESRAVPVGGPARSAEAGSGSLARVSSQQRSSRWRATCIR